MSEVSPKEISRDGIRTLMRRGAQLIDVLPREEYNRSHLTGAESIPLSHFDRRLADRLKWDKPVIVYSRDSLDDISARAAWRLASMGFTQIYRYTLGKADWLANGYPAEGSEARLPGAGDLADMDIATCPRSERMSDLRDRANKENLEVCVVVNAEEVVLGLLRRIAFEKADPRWIAEEAMETAPQTFRPNTPVEELRAFFTSNPGIESILITTTEGKLFGHVRRADLPE